jgi:hypothetical protein
MLFGFMHHTSLWAYTMPGQRTAHCHAAGCSCCYSRMSCLKKHVHMTCMQCR